MNDVLNPDQLSMLNQTLNGNDLKIVLDLLQHADRLEEDGAVFYRSPVDDIAQRVNLSQATVYKRLRTMTAQGRLTVKRSWTRGRGGAAKIYAINV